jgi:hypothetical protein
MKTTSLFVALIAIVSLTVAWRGEPETKIVTLEMRTDNGPYKNSAYSFRQATRDAKVHRNYVDLLLNNCGMLHISTVSGNQNRIVDLGEAKLADAPDEAPADAKWMNKSIKPVAGHVYLEEINEDGQTMMVKFHVDEVTDRVVKFTWTTIKPLAGPAPDEHRGAAGTMGQCGGEHPPG